VIDTEAFQRLRRIVQTSYEPLYPSATHNRFVHSLGVYHLGAIVANVVRNHSFEGLKKVMGRSKNNYDRYLEVFRIAAVLQACRFVAYIRSEA
jgi:HD superfamily phosphohydrolase